jgi:hypothetical protein
VFQSELLALYQRVRDWEIKRNTFFMRIWIAVTNLFQRKQARPPL